MILRWHAATKPYSVRDAGRGERRFFSLLSPLSSHLGGRAYSALPCAGAPPPQRPRPCSRRSECVGNVKLSSRGGRAYPQPRVLAGTEYAPAQARQARQLPYMPNVHRDDHRASPLQRCLRYIPPRQTAHSTHTEQGLAATVALCFTFPHLSGSIVSPDYGRAICCISSYVRLVLQPSGYGPTTDQRNRINDGKLRTRNETIP